MSRKPAPSLGLRGILRAMRTINTSKYVALAIALATLAGGACVSSSKHEATLKQLKTCEGNLGTRTGELDTCQSEKAAMEKRALASESEARAERERREAVEKDYKGILENLSSTQAELEGLRKQKAEAEKRLAAQRALTERFRQMVDSGKIKITLRGGRMIMQLPSGVLFDSGKSDLSKEGKAVLTEVAGVLKEFPDRRFIIAGHTDNVPLRGSKLKDNWELSTARALTVTKFLISQGVSPNNLSAAGYGEFDPIGDNASDEGKAGNRRIEIILVPNLGGLPMDPADAAAPAATP